MTLPTVPVPVSEAPDCSVTGELAIMPVTFRLPPVTVVGPVKLLMPESVRVPVPVLVTLLALLMALKLGVCWYLFTAQPRFTQNKGLVALLVTSLLGNLLVGFLHAIVPRPVAAITDRLGAIIVAIAAIIWAVVLVIGSLPAIWKAARASA